MSFDAVGGPVAAPLFTQLQPLQASEYVALDLGSAQVQPEDVFKLPSQPAKVVSDPLAQMASTGHRGQSKSLFGHCSTSTWLVVFLLTCLASRGSRHSRDVQAKAYALLDLLCQISSGQGQPGFLEDC